MSHFIQHLLDQYGYYVLVLSLMLELLALPLPGEVLMTYTGLMIYQGHLHWGLSILAAGLGASIGMTISYGIGYKLGLPFFERHGAKIHFGPEKLKKTSKWFERYGNKLIMIAYFIPGIRHFTGYFSGIVRTPFRRYAAFAYIGAFFWTGLFISLGKVLGPKWEQFHHTITKYLIIAGVAAAFIFLLVYLYRGYRVRIYNAAVLGLNKGFKTFHSLGKVKFLIIISSGVFLTLFILMLGLVQDFLAHEFADFDDIATFIVQALFDETWAVWMNWFAYLASFQVLLTIAALALIWIMIKSRDQLLEVGFLLFVLVGGELWDEGLRRLFHRVGPQSLPDTFPSEQTLITLIFLGFAVYLFVRHIHISWVRTAALLIVLAVSVLVGISRVYFDIQFPSDVVAGYVFGGVWLSLNIVLLEIFRLTKFGKLDLFNEQ